MKLIIDDVKKSFDKKEVLKGATYTFEHGKIYGLLGRNGAGKTTLFNCINQDLPIDRGTILFETEEGIQKPLDINEIGYVLSTPVVPEFLTAREFLRFFLQASTNRTPDDTQIESYLDFMMIDVEDRGKLLKDYSHGMKNKIQMLVNFIYSPSVLLLDEPLTSFDVVTADEMKDLLRKQKKECITILSTHIMELALDICDEIIILHEGTLEEIERDQLDDDAYKDKIINALKSESHV